jgi:hypothetical protein
MTRSKWTEVFASMSDSAFFEVVRHYLGPVSTPFHKPDLISGMEEFFGNPGVFQRLLEFIDPDDAFLLTYIAFSGEATDEQLGRMIPDMSPVILRERLLNLEERLLAWSRPGPKGRVYELTPAGQQVKNAGFLGPGAVIGPGSEAVSPKGVGWFDDNFLTSALAFLNESVPLFRKEGGWRKKTLETLKSRFPTLFRDSRGEDRLILAGRALISAGLAVRREEVLEPKMETWRDLESMKDAHRRALMTARAAAGRSIPSDVAIQAVRLITECLPINRSWEPDQLARLFHLSVGTTPLSPSGARRIIAHLELMGCLVSDGSGKLCRREIESHESQSENLLSVTPVGDITLKPNMGLFCDLALTAEPVSHDVVTTFRWTKERFLAGLDYGISPKKLFSGLEEKSGRAVPENIKILAAEWEAEYNTMSLKLGVVLQATGIRREIIEKTGVLEPFSHSRPADGIWLLDPADEDRWREALSDVGIDRIPPVVTPSGRPSSSIQAGSADHPPYLPWNGIVETPEICQFSWDKVKEVDIKPVIDELAKHAKSVNLSQQEYITFQERLDRRVILVPEQIRKGAWRYEVMSAKGLDYRGKLRLAEAAINGRDDRVEVTLAVGNDVITRLMLPDHLEKDGEDHVLVGLSLPEEEEMRIKIRKIGFMKRIKASLF